MVPPTGRPYELFISYGRGDDIPFTEKLYADLTRNNYEVWFDRRDLESNGLSFLQSIRDSLAINPIRVLLIIGPHAYKSDYVRFEWEFALANCIVIIPILRMGQEKDENGLPKKSSSDYDLLPAPIRKRKLDCINFRRERSYEDALNELLHDLATPILPLARLYSVPNKPANFISRENEVEKIKEIVMGDSFSPGVITSVGKTAAVQGMGGIGKSVLASSVCHDCDVKRSFADGVYWITIGQHQPEINVTKGIQLLTGDEKINLRDNFEETKNKLRNTLQKKNCLIVLDDVWDQKDISIFQTDEALRCRLLITTRNKQTVRHLAAKIIEVGLLDMDAARLLLAKSASGQHETTKYHVDSLPAQADLIIEECGHLPLAIDMAGGMIRAGDQRRWKDVLEALQEADLNYIEQQFPDYPYPNLFKVLEVSVELLDFADQIKYRQLAIFPNDVVIPQEMIHLLWKEDGASERHTNKLLDELLAHSLLQRTKDGFYTIHDLQVDYLRKTCKNLQEISGIFITRLGDPLLLSGEYAWNNYIWHLIAAGQSSTALTLLQSFDWIRTKLLATDINDLLKDYELFDSLDKSTELIYEALKLSTYILSEDKNQLALNLIGRLGNYSDQVIIDFLEKAKQYQASPWLKPVISTMTSPSVLKKIINLGETSDSPFILWQDKIIYSVFSGSINIIHIDSGKIIHRIPSAATHLVTYMDKYLVAGADDAIIRIWNLADCTPVHISHAFPDYVSCLMIHGDFAVAGFGDGSIATIGLSDHFKTTVVKKNAEAISFIYAKGSVVVSCSNYNPVVDIWNLLDPTENYDSFNMHANVKGFLEYNNRLYFYLEDGVLEIFEIKENKLERVDALSIASSGSEFLKAYKNFIITEFENSIQVLNLDNHEVILLGHHTDTITSFYVMDHMLISGGFDKKIKIWSLDSFEEVKSLTGHSYYISTIEVYQDTILSLEDNGQLFYWKLNSNEEDVNIKQYECSGFLCMKEFLIYLGPVGDIVVMDTLKLTSESIQPSGQVLSIDCTDEFIYYTTTEEEIICMVMPGGIRIAKNSVPGGSRINGLCDDKIFITCPSRKKDKFSVMAFSQKTLELLGTFESNLDAERIELLNASLLIFGQNYSTEIEIRDHQSFRKVPKLKIKIPGNLPFIQHFTVNSSSIICCTDEKVYTLQPSNGTTTHIAHIDIDKLYGFDANHTHMALGGWVGDHDVKIYEKESLALIQRFEKHSTTIDAIKIIGDKVISSSIDRTVYVWRIQDQKIMTKLNLDESISNIGYNSVSKTVILHGESGRLYLFRASGFEFE